MDYPQVRRAALEALRRQPSTQWINFQHTFGQVAYEMGFVQAPQGLDPSDRNFRANVYHATAPQDKERLREVFWALLVEGVVILGMNDSNPEWPWFKVTEYGERVLDSGEIIPHDPDGYLEWMRTECAPFDEVAEFYLAEALLCFLRGTYTASAVMLGVATERLFLLVLQAFISAQPQPAADRLRKATETRLIARQWNEFRRRLDSQLESLPEALKEDLDVVLNGIFSLIRTTRNESGHPSGRRVKRETMYAHLQLFRQYAQRVVALTQHYAARPQP